MSFFDFSVASVLPTFFDDNNLLDFDSMKNVVEYQINQGIKNVVILGTTSETPTLNDEEKFSLVKYFYETFGDKLNFIVGVGGNDTVKTIVTIKEYEPYAHAYLATVPYYNKPNQKGMEYHFSAIANTTNKPIMLYNVPSRTGSSINPDTVSKLYKKHDNIQAIKEASGDLDQVQKIICGSDIKVYSGDDSLTLPIMSIGGQGVVSVASNAIPQMMIQFTNSIKNQSNMGNRIEFNKMIYPFWKSCFLDTNPGPIKYYLYKMKLTKNCGLRLPLIEPSDEVKEKLDEEFGLVNQSNMMMNVLVL